MSKYWFVYSAGSIQDSSSILVTSNYYKAIPSFSPGYTGTGSKIEFIKASGYDSNMRPYYLSTRIQSYITAGFNSGNPQPATIGKKYVYLKV